MEYKPKHAKPHKVCIVGSGNWASAISRIVGENVLKYPDIFQPLVAEWVFEEIINGQKITAIINTDHVNVKYLPGVKLPDNVVAIPDLLDAIKNATVLVFVVPHQFLQHTCAQLKGKIIPTALGISLTKGVIATETHMQLISAMISELLHIRVSVLMGANIANEVAAEYFCEATVASRNTNDAVLFKKLFETNYFQITTVPDVGGVELCGALKNVVAVAAGFVDGLGLASSTKVTVLRLGFMEIIKFVELFHPGTQTTTFLQSSGVADLIATCYGGRNHLVAEAFVKDVSRPITEIEKELLNGQHLQGPDTAAEINIILKRRGFEKQFPVFTAVHKVCARELPPSEFVNFVKNHPEYSKHNISKRDFLPEADDDY